MSKEMDLSNYQTVKERKKAFYESNPDGRIVVELLNLDTIMDYCVIKTTIYRNNADQACNLPWSTGYAQEIRDKELKENKWGKKYESVNYTSWLENCEESSVGRALDNAGFATNNKCSREEIEKAARQAQTIKNSKTSYNQTQLDMLRAKFKKKIEEEGTGWITTFLNDYGLKSETEIPLQSEELVGKMLSWEGF